MLGEDEVYVVSSLFNINKVTDILNKSILRGVIEFDDTKTFSDGKRRMTLKYYPFNPPGARFVFTYSCPGMKQELTLSLSDPRIKDEQD